MTRTPIRRTPFGQGRKKARMERVPAFVPEKAPGLKRLDEIAGNIVKAHFDYECQLGFLGGCGGCIDAHHILRKPGAVRYDLRGLLPVCRLHHTWVHSHTAESKRIFVSILGEVLYDELYQLSKTTVRMSPSWRIQVREELWRAV